MSCEDNKKKIEVVAAVIYKNKDGEKKIFTAQRGYGEFKGKWEFPGGKIEQGETNEQALVREIREELNSVIEVERFICTVDYDYESFYLKMHVYECSLISGKLELLEHESAKWISYNQLKDIDWLPADEEVIKKIN